MEKDTTIDIRKLQEAKLIHKGLFSHKDEHLRMLEKVEAGGDRDYDIKSSLVEFRYDKNHVYNDQGESISMRDLLKNKVITKEELSSLEDLLAENGLRAKLVTDGYTEPIEYMGEFCHVINHMDKMYLIEPDWTKEENKDELFHVYVYNTELEIPSDPAEAQVLMEKFENDKNVVTKDRLACHVKENIQNIAQANLRVEKNRIVLEVLTHERLATKQRGDLKHAIEKTCTLPFAYLPYSQMLKAPDFSARTKDVYLEPQLVHEKNKEDKDLLKLVEAARNTISRAHAKMIQNAEKITKENIKKDDPERDGMER